jgi:murein DD-endopeptidase MepM/ murein hydrolase activator NlpD
VKRLLVLAAVTIVCGAAGASADVTLPSSSAPNAAAPTLPPAWLQPPAQPQSLSYDELLAVWRRAGDAYGVPWNVLAAINKIESDFGRNMGPSSAGAIGWMQFMPDTWLRWGTDADGDGTADPWNPVDAVYSAARYLAAAGAAKDLRGSVYSYNHAWWYVDEVMSLAQQYAAQQPAPAAAPAPAPAPASAPAPAPQEQPTTAAPAPDDAAPVAAERLRVKIDRAQNEVARRRAAYEQAAAAAAAQQARENTLAGQAQSAPLLSDRLDAQREAAQAGVARAAAGAEADRLRTRLERAEQRLAGLEQHAQPGPSGNPAATAPAAASAATRWVFPVAGGPSVVSVAHGHHDYPAADIAAPEGSQLYALSDGEVLYAWAEDARCGTGFTMRTGDGQVWTYCYLASLDPAVQPGARLAAGQPVGLVGQTGDGTGPHLHLQLQPATAYPQQESWFASLAGVAFSWREDADPPARSTGSGPVFTIVQEPSN